MAIRFFNEEIVFTLKNKRKLISWIKSIVLCNHYKVGDINYIFTSNDKILEINKKYLNHDYFTDIITFNYNLEDLLSGDIYISMDTVRQNSELFGVSVENETYRVMIHGILHLLGYDDLSDTEKEQMRKLEDDALEELVSKYLIK